jgi:peptidoglycan/xylan/chitin deacetylase (PgdA/CDA1 family)
MKVHVFNELMNYCSKHYTAILPHQWKESTPAPKLIITFDDGFYDFLDHAVPILRKYNLPAVHHVVISSVLENKPNWTYRLNIIIEDHLKSGKKLLITEDDVRYNKEVTVKNVSGVAIELLLLLKDLPLARTETVLNKLENGCTGDLYFPRMMNENDLKQCEGAGIEIGSHGLTHTFLRDSVAENILRREVIESKNELEKILDHPVQCFAFPAGFYDQRAIDLASEAGYKYLFAVEDRFFSIEENNQSPVLFPRILMSTASADEAILKIEGFHSSFKKWFSKNGRE